MWISCLFCFVFAAVFCWPLTLAARRLGMKMRIYSTGGYRHVNKSPVPRLGGGSVFISFIITVCAIFYFLHWNQPQGAEQSKMVSLFCGAACIWLLGLFDDIWNLRARYKLLFQIAVATGMYLLGLQIHAIHFPILGVLNFGDYSGLFTVLWIVGAINAVNLIDGIDGLCSGVALCSFLGIFCLAIFYSGNAGAIICCALIGCTLTLLVFNFSPASIFLGDSGAYFLGFMAAVLPIFIVSESSSPGVFHVAFIMFILVPFLDTSLAIVRRLIRGVPMSTPDRGHLHHRLLDRGYTHKKITVTISAISLVFIITGVMIALGNHWLTALAILAAASAVFLLLYLCGIGSLKDIIQKHATNVTKVVLLKEYAPALFHNLTGAGDWAQAQKILDNFSRNTEMCWAKITCQKNGSHNIVWDWRDELSSPCRRQPQLCKTYKILHNDICYQFYYCWDSEYSSVQNDTDALLEVISKTIGKSFHEKFFAHDNAVF